MVTKITESRYSEARSTYEGWCVECLEFTRSQTEPDAEGYDCPVCEENTVIGAENLLWSDEIVVIPDDAPPGGGILAGKVLEESITAAMMSRVLSVETGERLLAIHEAVCRDIFCGGCGHILDTHKSVLVEATIDRGDSVPTPLILETMGSFVRCGTCWDEKGRRLQVAYKNATFAVTDFRNYGPDFRLKTEILAEAVKGLDELVKFSAGAAL
jgi:hypothetical protein